MDASLPGELAQLDAALAAAGDDARELVAGLSEVLGGWRAEPGSWSVAECLDHLATANRVYLAAMRPAAEHAREAGRRRRRPALPGLVGGWFVGSLEPSERPRLRMRAPRQIRPRAAPALADAAAVFFDAHAAARAFLRAHADLDLAGARFPNPFVAGVRFSLATGLHVIAAHERRHLRQAWRARRGAELAAAAAKDPA